VLHKTHIRSREAGLALIDFLCQRFPYHSKEVWLEKIQIGQIKIANQSTFSLYCLNLGDEIYYEAKEIDEPPVNWNYKILWENDRLLAIDKPPNLVIHPAGRYRNNTLLSALRRQFQDCQPVHRIDRETSGIVLFTKEKRFGSIYQKLFEDRKVNKKYLTLVHGNCPKEFEACGYLAKDYRSHVRKKMKFSFAKVGDLEREVETLFKKLQYIEEADWSLLLAIPKTGRLHQIRATLYSLGYPIVGDKLYGLDERKFLQFAKTGEISDLDFPRQALHSYSLEFKDPFDNQWMQFSSQIPKDWIELNPILNNSLLNGDIRLS